MQEHNRSVQSVHLTGLEQSPILKYETRLKIVAKGKHSSLFWLSLMLEKCLYEWLLETFLIGNQR